jgi:hypothetical protein
VPSAARPPLQDPEEVQDVECFALQLSVVWPPIRVRGLLIENESSTSGTKVGSTVHALVIEPVVNTFPFNVPPHPFASISENPAEGVKVKVVVDPCSTTALAGVTVPPVIAAMETVYFLSRNDAITEHGAEIGPVVNVEPDKVPPHPETSAIS